MKYFFNFFKGFVIVYLSIFISSTYAQLDDYSDFQLIRDEGFKNSALRELAISLTDEIGPRLNGTQGCINSVNWAVKKLKDFDIQSARLEEWGEFGNGWQMNKFYIAMTNPYYQPLVAVPRAWTGSTSGPVKAEVTLVTANSLEELEKYVGMLKGKVVITPYKEDLTVSFEPLAKRFTEEEIDGFADAPEVKPDQDKYIKTRKLASNSKSIPFNVFKEFCEKEGAIAIIENSGSFGVVRSYGDRSGRLLKELGISIIDMTHEHYARMVRLLDRGIFVELDLDINNSLVSDFKTGYNVIAEIPGDNENIMNEVVMIGAHIDSWHAGTGGNDNGSGVIVMMEVMRILKQSGVKLDRTVRIALWTGEEQGLWGSRKWVEKNLYNLETNEKGPEFDKISAYYNFDYGTGRIRGIFLQDNIALKPIFEEFFKPVSDLGVRAMSMRNPGSSDHVPFNRLGIPGFAFIQDRIDYGRTYHTNFDTFERIQLGDLKQAAVVVATLVYQTANHPEKFPRKEEF